MGGGRAIAFRILKIEIMGDRCWEWDEGDRSWLKFIEAFVEDDNLVLVLVSLSFNLFMSAKDIVHDIVRDALEKDGWIITHDPFFLRVSEKIGMFLDLAASKLLIAEKQTIKIAVEVKSFVGLSTLTDFHLAVGQFLNYRLALEEFEPDRILYLAIPEDIYNTFFQDSFVEKVIERYSLKLIVFNSQKGEIILWKPLPSNN